jgi:hypothetical protein
MRVVSPLPSGEVASFALPGVSARLEDTGKAFEVLPTNGMPETGSNTVSAS